MEGTVNRREPRPKKVKHVSRVEGVTELDRIDN